MPTASSVASPAAVAEGRERILYLDDLRVLATVAVVWLHTTAPYVDALRLPTAFWWVANLQQSAVRFAVAIFVMISGALLLAPGPHPPAGRFLARRLLRVGVPLLVWSLAYALFRSAFGIPFDARALLRAFLAGSTHYHLYFLFAILGLYVWTPLLRRLLQPMSSSGVAWLTALVWAATLVYSASSEWAGSMSDVTDSAFTKFLPFVGYYLLGHGLHDRWPRPLSRPAILALLGLGYAGVLLGTGLFVSWYGARPPGRYPQSILSPTGVLYSTAVFLWVQSLAAGSGQRLRSSVAYRAIRDGSLGIYLLHPMVLVLGQIAHRATGPLLPMGLDLPLLALAVLGVCTLATAALSAVPGLRVAVGATRPYST